MNYDLIIIGAGPGGYYSAELALKNNLSVLLIEKDKVGGVCLNYGCIPSKSFLYNAKMFHKNQQLQNLAYSLDNLVYDQSLALSIKNSKVKQIVDGLEHSLIAQKCNIVYGDAYILAKENNLFKVSVSNTIYTSTYLIIASGSSAQIPPLKGIGEISNNSRFITSTQALELKQIPKSLVIIGGGVIALEMASYYMQIGSKVTMLVRNDILTEFDVDIKNTLQTYLTSNFDFKIYKHATNIEFNVDIVNFEVEGEKMQVNFDKVLLATGRRANVDNLGLENIHLDYERKKINVNNKMETNVVNCYAIGDVKGFMMLAHSAYREAEVAIDQIMGKNTYMNYDSIPSVIYTSPEVASCGLNSNQATKLNLDFYEIQNSLLVSGKFVIENENFNGLIKFIIEKNTNKVLGVHIIGDNSGEVIGICSLIINKKMTKEMLESLVLPHPSIGEILKSTLMLK